MKKKVKRSSKKNISTPAGRKNRSPSEILSDRADVAEREIRGQVTDKANKSKEPLPQRPWFIIMTFIISLLGVSGSVIKLIDFFNRKPTFEFDPTAVLIQNITDTSEGSNKMVKSNFVLVGTVSNRGSDPLLPNGWRLDFVMENGDTILTDRTFSPPRIAVDFPHPKDSIIFENADRHDLQRVKQVHFKEPVFGHLVFIIYLLPIEFDEMKDKVTCVLHCYDIRKKEYIVKFKCPTGTLDTNGNYPKNDLYIKPYKK